jgi:hypothetical protein
MRSAERHAQRLLRCYPRTWRERYGDELAALIVDDVTDQPRSLRRDLDVVRAGLGARLSGCGMTAATAAVASAVVFVASALSIWTQLADGWLAAPPDSAAVTVGMVTLSLWLGAIVMLAAVAAARLARAAVRTARAGHLREVLRPLCVLLVSAGVFVAGVRLMAPRWPGSTGGRDGGLLAMGARVTWAATDSISTFWLHPHRLVGLPVGELVWMAVSPAAVIAAAWSASRLARAGRLPVSPRMPHVPTMAGITALPCFVTASAWVVGSQHAVNATYRAGTLDLVLIGLMATATLTARNALSPHPR